jgi:hypothetical protein
MRNITILAGTTFLIVVFIPISSMQVQAGPLYGEFGMGAYFPQSDTLKDANPAYSADFAVGYFFQPNIAGEFGLGIYQTSVPVYMFTGSKVKMPLDVTPLMLSVVVAGDRTGDLKPYIKAGGGWYFISYTPPLGDAKSEGLFGYQLGFGATFQSIGLEAKYLIAKENKPKIFQYDKIKVGFNGFVLTLVLSNF